LHRGAGAARRDPQLARAALAERAVGAQTAGALVTGDGHRGADVRRRIAVEAVRVRAHDVAARAAARAGAAVVRLLARAGRSAVRLAAVPVAVRRIDAFVGLGAG